jgi:hypothetical protein
MQARLETLNASSSIPLAARVGITTGEVLVSGDGNPIGDAMNTAARLQTAASPGSVLIGDPTYHLVRDAIMAAPGQTTKAVIQDAAQRLGLDWKRLERDMDDPAIQARIDTNLKLAHAVGIEGTPALVIGGEGEGIRPLVKKKCDVLMAIPLKGGVNSLNASVAGGVALFEIVRQRGSARGGDGKIVE